jgi:hypothetical protein
LIQYSPFFNESGSNTIIEVPNPEEIVIINIIFETVIHGHEPMIVISIRMEMIYLPAAKICNV